MPRVGGVKGLVARREDVWRYAGWIALAIAAVAYYGRYSKTPVNLVVYAIGAECFWNGQPFLECAPEFTYPPAVALLMLPFVPLSPELRLLIWYLISIAATVGCVALCEALVRRSYPAAADEPNLAWICLLIDPAQPQIHSGGAQLSGLRHDHPLRRSCSGYGRWPTVSR